MSVNSEGIDISQLPLFNTSPSTSAFELFPKVWTAAEALTSPNPEIRLHGLNDLIDLQAARFSSLICYLVCTKLDDPDIHVRKAAINVLAGVMDLDDQGNQAPEAVYQNLKFQLSRIQEPVIYALLDACIDDAGIELKIARLLRQNAHAGDILSEILANRKYKLAIRILAAQLIGKIGFIAAIPSIERTITRLETRLNGQPLFVVASMENDESNLLPVLRKTYEILTAL